MDLRYARHPYRAWLRCTGIQTPEEFRRSFTAENRYGRAEAANPCKFVRMVQPIRNACSPPGAKSFQYGTDSMAAIRPTQIARNACDDGGHGSWFLAPISLSPPSFRCSFHDCLSRHNHVDGGCVTCQRCSKKKSRKQRRGGSPHAYHPARGHEGRAATPDPHSAPSSGHARADDARIPGVDSRGPSSHRAHR